MPTKTNIAAIAAFSAILATPELAAAQAGFGNYPSAYAAFDAYTRPQPRLDAEANQPNARGPSSAYASARGGAHSNAARRPVATPRYDIRPPGRW